ncbi:MAG: Rieske (2Fe-2S) protein [Thermoanaerobaculia bacterium]|nr:Rieske (2Fe-2S) protein [Thermoanaerobaculia bacterium]
MPSIRLASLDEIPEGGMICRSHGEHQVTLAKVKGEVFAIDDVCTHAGAPLHEGVLGGEGDYLITCPWHDAHFDCRTGRADPDTPWGEDAASYTVRLEGDVVWVELPD